MCITMLWPLRYTCGTERFPVTTLIWRFLSKKAAWPVMRVTCWKSTACRATRAGLCVQKYVNPNAHEFLRLRLRRKGNLVTIATPLSGTRA